MGDGIIIAAFTVVVGAVGSPHRGLRGDGGLVPRNVGTLREVAAKRAVLAMHGESVDYSSGGTRSSECKSCGRAGHPSDGWDGEWLGENEPWREEWS